MPYSNNIITAPVGMHDIADALGTTSLDLGTLCTHPNIDKWARYKPIQPLQASNKIGFVTEAQRQAVNFGLTASTFQRAPLCATANYAWQYTRPSTWFRMFDFVKVSNSGVPSTTIGYTSVGVAPCRGFHQAGETTQLALYKYYTQQQRQADINVYAITTGSDLGIGLAEMADIADYYFALAVVKDSTHTYLVTSTQNIGAGISDPNVTAWQTIPVPTDSSIFLASATYDAYVLLCNQKHDDGWWLEQTSASHPLYYYALPVTEPSIAEITFNVIATNYSAWCDYASRPMDGTIAQKRKVTYSIYGQNTTSYAVTLDTLKVELVYAATADAVESATGSDIYDTDTYNSASIPSSQTPVYLSNYSGELGSTSVPTAPTGTLWVRVSGIVGGNVAFKSFTPVNDIGGNIPPIPSRD